MKNPRPKNAWTRVRKGILLLGPDKKMLGRSGTVRNYRTRNQRFRALSPVVKKGSARRRGLDGARGLFEENLRRKSYNLGVCSILLTLMLGKGNPFDELERVNLGKMNLELITNEERMLPRPHDALAAFPGPPRCPYPPQQFAETRGGNLLLYGSSGLTICASLARLDDHSVGVTSPLHSLAGS
jgi:hypothetical protein